MCICSVFCFCKGLELTVRNKLPLCLHTNSRIQKALFMTMFQMNV